MRATAPRTQNLAEEKAKQLHGSGLSQSHLRLGASAVLAQKLPLRDAPVLREAARFAAMQTPEVRAAAARAGQHIRAAIPESSFAIWIAPLRVIGADGSTLLLTAPEGIRTWVERRYAPLIRGALQGTGYTGVAFVGGEDSP